MSDRWYDDVERLWFKLGNGPMGQSRLYLAGKLPDQPSVRWDDQAQAGVAMSRGDFGPWSRTGEILARRIEVLQSSQAGVTTQDKLAGL